MSTKLKTIPLPSGLAPLPKGAVYLGAIPEQPHTFTGFLYQSPRRGWEPRSALRGGMGHYAAPRDSAIAREILGVKDEPKETPFRSDPVNRSGERKPKKSAKKAPTLRKLPKNVKPGTKVVLFDAKGCLGVKKGETFEATGDVGGTALTLKGKLGTWGKHRFRLAPAKKRVQRTKKIGVMPARIATAEIVDKYENDCAKFGRMFTAYAANAGIALPDWLTTLLPVPAGLDRWEPRGMGWKAADVIYGCVREGWPSWSVYQMPETTCGLSECFYIEAVRDEKAVEKEPEAPVVFTSEIVDSRTGMTHLERRLCELLFAKAYRSDSVDVIRSLAALAVIDHRPETLMCLMMASGGWTDSVSGETANADVDLPDTAAQDSASKSNSPAVSG